MEPLLYVPDFAKHKNKVMQKDTVLSSNGSQMGAAFETEIWVRKMNKKDIIETWEQMVAFCIKKQIETHFGLNSDVDSGEPNKKAITV